MRLFDQTEEVLHLVIIFSCICKSLINVQSLCALTGDGEVTSEVIPGQLSPQQDSAVSLPASLFQRFDDRENVGVFFAFYEKATLFPVGRRNVSGRQTQVGSQVVAATVNSSNELIDLEDPVILVFRLQLTPGQVYTTSTF